MRSQEHRCHSARGLVNDETAVHACGASATQLRAIGLCLPPLPQIPLCSGRTSILKLVSKEDYGFKSTFPWKQPIINAIWRGGMQLPKLSGKKWSDLATLSKPLLTVFASFPSCWPASFDPSEHLAPICWALHLQYILEDNCVWISAYVMLRQEKILTFFWLISLRCFL